MNAAADHASTFLHGLERGRPERTHGRENDGRVERLRRRLVRAAGPGRAKLAGKMLRRRVARARESIDLKTLPHRDLRQEMRGRSEAIDAEVFPLARHAIAAPSDQARA